MSKAPLFALCGIEPNPEREDQGDADQNENRYDKWKNGHK
jgi:hypothetical protein